MILLLVLVALHWNPWNLGEVFRLVDRLITAKKVLNYRNGPMYPSWKTKAMFVLLLHSI